MTRVFIISARRTPFGRFRGSLSETSTVDLASIAAKAVIGHMHHCAVDHVILGNVLSAGQGMNIARQVAINIGLPISTPAFTINMMCGSGMQAALLGAQAIRSGDAHAVLVGGVESMSQSPMLIARPPRGQQVDVECLVDSIECDGLIDTFSNRHMGETAEDLAEELKIGRREQDAWAERSQKLYAMALEKGMFADEIVPVGEFSQDEHPRPNSNRQSLAALQPAFDPKGTITAGNASGINDGASMLLLADEKTTHDNGWSIMAELKGGTTIGCDPQRMGLGPVFAIEKLLRQTGQQLTEFDHLEINEAFAAQTLACLRLLEIRVNLSQPEITTGSIAGLPIKVNPHGGAIAIGHPLGASGARLLTHLAWQISKKQSLNAVASLCIGGGMGIAASLSAP